MAASRGLHKTPPRRAHIGRLSQLSAPPKQPRLGHIRGADVGLAAGRDKRH